MDGTGLMSTIRRGAVSTAFAVALGLSATAHAIVTDSNIPGCGANGSNCFFSVGFNGQTLGTGNFQVAENGALDLFASGVWRAPNGNFIRVEDLEGNQDPVLGFSASAGTGDVGGVFTVSFNLPVNIAGEIFANSAIGYTLTALTAAGASIQPIFSSNTIMRAYEVDTTVGGLRALNKGVDAGDGFAIDPGGAGPFPVVVQSPIYRASSSFIGSPAYDTMTVIVGFALSPNSEVGLSGFVQQIPEPSSYLLVLAGLGFVAFVVRRRLAV